VGGVRNPCTTALDTPLIIITLLKPQDKWGMSGSRTARCWTSCRSNEIKTNHIKCRILVGGKNGQCWLLGETATHTRHRGRNRTQTTLMKGECSSQCANPGSHSFSSSIDQGLKREKHWKPDRCSSNHTKFSSSFNFLSFCHVDPRSIHRQLGAARETTVPNRNQHPCY